MVFQPTPDINVLITVPSEAPNQDPLVATERRINPTWTILQLKLKLEPITGIPSSSQNLHTKTLEGTTISLSNDESIIGDAKYNIRKGSEITITDTRPISARGNFTDVSSVEKYEMPVEQYEQLNDSVLAWKKRQKLGRFDPSAKTTEEIASEKRDHDLAILQQRGIQVDKRCRVGGEDTRRGIVRFVGEIDGLGGEKEIGCVWVGVELDEPSGRNDGSIAVVVKDDGQTNTVTKRLFTCKDNFGVFARPEKIEVGDFPPYDDLLDDEDMEEL